MLNQKFLILSDFNVVEIIKEDKPSVRNKQVHSYLLRFTVSITKMGMEFTILKDNFDKMVSMNQFKKII